jgi:hypothetical protein
MIARTDAVSLVQRLLERRTRYLSALASRRPGTPRYQHALTQYQAVERDLQMIRQLVQGSR